jgi:plastocyanin
MRRIWITLPILILLSACCCNQGPSVAPAAVPYGAAVVAIDDDLHANPDPVHAQRGATIHFVHLNPNHELSVDSSAFDNVQHQGGHAWAHVRTNAEYGVKHKYTVHDLTTKKDNDPILIIDP